MPSSSKSGECDWIAWGAKTPKDQSFGTSGLDGANARSGKNGRDSDSMTIFANGSPMTLNLSGQNGADGTNGDDGKDGNCVKQPEEVSYDLQAAHGGNGGNGGNGGDGGDGGSLTIYTTNPANLAQISVIAEGGKGGNPGNGGNGGKGCNCDVPYWSIQTCTGDPGDDDYRCTTQDFQCQNGRNGGNGGNGKPGRDGVLGKLTLINLDRPLEPDRPAATVPIAQLKDVGYILSKNTWETREGATALFAPGAVIDDQYLALVERLERSFILIWNAPQSFNQFSDRRITINLASEQGIDVSIPKDIWIEATTQQQNNLTEFVVYNAMLASDATQLKSEGIIGNGTNLQLTLVDLADQSNLINTKFKLKYRTTRSDPRFRPVNDYATKYDGELPTDLIQLNGDRFTLNLGQLPVKPEDIQPGTGVEIEIVATRSFAGYSAEQKIIVRDMIGPFR